MSEKTEKKVKRTLKPNVIDFLIILVVIGAVLGIALRSGAVDDIAKREELEEATISFLILDINDNSGNYFNIGDTFRSTAYAQDLGVLESVQFMPAEAFITSQDGHLIKTYSNNGRIDVRGTLKAKGVFSDVGFLLGGNQYIAPGNTLHVQSKYMDVSLTITDIVKAEKDA